MNDNGSTCLVTVDGTAEFASKPVLMSDLYSNRLDSKDQSVATYESLVNVNSGLMTHFCM
jgi:hypothetical protein